MNALNDVVQPKFMSMDFDFKTFRPSHDNLFQIGNSASALRMEITPPGTLTLMLGQGKHLIVSHHIEPNRSYHIRLLTDFNEYLKVYFEEKTYRIPPHQLEKMSYDFSEFVVGTGLYKLRPLQGEIEHLKLALIYSQKTMFHKILGGLMAACVLMIGVLVLVHLKSQWPHKSSYQLPSLLPLLALTGWGVSFGLFSCIVTHYAHLPTWLPYCVVLISVISLIFSPVILRKKLLRLIDKNQWFFGSLPLITLLFLMIKTLCNHGYHCPFSICFFLITSFLISLSFVVPISKNYRYVFKQLPIILFLVSVSLLGWASVFDLPNWVDTYEQITNSYISFCLGLVVLLIAIIFVFHDKPDSILRRKTFRRSFYIIDLAAVLAFLWLSFRFDPLGNTALQLKYVAAPIEALKNGGWLLWDTPSQHGFLNILLASLIPIKSSWQCFYLFQGLLLFVVANLWYAVAKKYAQQSLFNRMVGLLLIISSLFCADPQMMGPYLYPFSSVLRFFWCYILIAYFLWKPVYASSQSLGMSLLWILGVLWSAESAMYATCIFFSASFAQFFWCLKSRSHILSSLVLRHFIIPLGLFVFTLIAVSLFYKLTLHHFPDWRCFMQYSQSSASGVGMPFIHRNGYILYSALLFIGLIHVYIGLDKSFKKSAYQVPIAAMFGCLWAVITYIMGTAEPDAMITLLPVLGFIVYFALLMTKNKSLGLYKVTLQLTAVPIICLLLMDTLSPRLWQTILSSQTMTPNIESKLFAPTNTEVKELTT